MTILSGTVYAVESFAEFRDALDVSWKEVAESLGEEHQQAMLAAVNDTRVKRDQPEADTISDLERVEIMEWIEAAHFTDSRLVQSVLETRDQDYTHVIDGLTQRIIELGTSPTDEDMAVAMDLLTLLLSDQVPEVQAEGQQFTVSDVDLDYDCTLEMDSGADVLGVSVTQDSVTLNGQIKMGQGSKPYADDPSEHRSLLGQSTLANTEGSVVYEQDGEAVSLPKFLYFEEERRFDERVDTPSELAEAVANALGFEVVFEWVTGPRME